MIEKIQESDSMVKLDAQPAEINQKLFIDFLKNAAKEIEAAAREYFDDFSLSVVENSFVRESLRALVGQNEGGKRIRGALIKLGEQIASQGQNNK